MCVQQENISSGCSKRLFSRATEKNRPLAYPLGYVEDLFKTRTTLAAFFSILLEEDARGRCPN
jgi:hypothetical protein